MELSCFIVATKRLEDCEELQDEVNRLEQRLREKQNEFFQILRSNCKKKAPSRKTKDVPFVHPEVCSFQVILFNSIIVYHFLINLFIVYFYFLNPVIMPAVLRISSLNVGSFHNFLLPDCC